MYALFELDQRLQQDTLAVADLALCRLLLMNDRQYPWFILVPRCAQVRELFELSRADQEQLWQETRVLAECLHSHCCADKMNIAFLGNVVSQLHIHVVARYQQDKAWPHPVWGRHPTLAYAVEDANTLQTRILERLQEQLIVRAVP